MPGHAPGIFVQGCGDETAGFDPASLDLFRWQEFLPVRRREHFSRREEFHARRRPWSINEAGIGTDGLIADRLTLPGRQLR
jgi:hypothetical protein